MNDKLNNIWKELEDTKPYSQGILKKRYSPDCLADVYVGLKVPENLRLLLIRLSWKTGKSITNFPTLKGIRVEKIVDEEGSEKHLFLTMLLTESLFADVFSVLAEDIIESIRQISDERRIVKHFFDRLHKWQTLFEKYREEGLASEMQRGLYGELYFLRKLLSETGKKIRHIKSWVGPAEAIQDFQYPHVAIEVKTSVSKQPQKIQISSERQLDEHFVSHLFLFYLSLDVREGQGETLPELVKSVSNILTDDLETFYLFKERLAQVGYFESQEILYLNTGYSLRDEYLFNVIKDFPRLTEKDVPPGVGEVKYSIDLSVCMPFRCGYNELVTLLNQL